LFEELELELQHFHWPAQSSNINIIEAFWSILETRLRNRFPPPTFLKHLENVLQEEWYKETVQNLYEPIPRRIAAVLKAKGGSAPYYKVMYTLFVVFPLFCLVPVYFHMYE
jgi:hypothetical protein